MQTVRRTAALVLAAGLAGALARPQPALARSDKAFAYPRDAAWPAAVRFLVVDEHLKVYDKDADAGYALFELKDAGKTYRGSLELVLVTVDERPNVRIVITIEDRPSWMELAMLTRLERKLRAELGPPAPPPSKPGLAPSKPTDGKPAAPPEPAPPADGGPPDLLDALTSTTPGTVPRMRTVDLRSDTVTRPTAPMRHAMADAEVGDDVYGEDPTVRALEERVAALLGTESALFVPTGVMANQIALRAHTRPGDEIIISKDAHCWRHESGALGALAGVQTQPLAEHRFTAADVRAAFRGDDPYVAPTKVVAVENTHNMGGGLCWDPAALAEVTAAAHALGMVTHLDGARLWNAAIATGTTEAQLAAGFDSVSVCLSKGLGAPVGSVVAGGRDFIRRCHRFRKMYGGGMRQVGILAAAGLYALDHHRARLAEDHANAQHLARGLAGAPGLAVDPARVQTNIVMIDLEHGTAEAAVALAREDGVRLGTAGPRRVRAVTHLDVDREDIERAVQVVAGIAAQLAAAA